MPDSSNRADEPFWGPGGPGGLGGSQGGPLVFFFFCFFFSSGFLVFLQQSSEQSRQNCCTSSVNACISGSICDSKALLAKDPVSGLLLALMQPIVYRMGP